MNTEKVWEPRPSIRHDGEGTVTQGESIMKASKLVATFAVLASVVGLSATALADGNDGGKARDHHGAFEKKFPMPGAEFKSHVEERLTKGRARMEKKISEKAVPADKAAQMRAKFDQRAAEVRAKADQAAADGVVTLDEAKAMRPAHGHHRHGKA
jgi:hypothetical protein